MAASYTPAGLILVCFMVAAAMSSVPSAEAQTDVFGVIRINGTVLCAVNATLTPNAPAFANATVQLKCLGVVVETTKTSSTGNFGISLGPLESVLSQILKSCNLVVATPLATCNATLPTASAGGLLNSILTYANSTVTTLGTTVYNLVPTLFGI